MVGVSSGHESEPDWTIPMTSALDCLIGASLVSLATSLSISRFWFLESIQSLCCCGSWPVQPEAMVLVLVRPDATALDVYKQWSWLSLSTQDSVTTKTMGKKPRRGPVGPLSVALVSVGPVPMVLSPLRRERTCLGPVRPVAVASVGLQRGRGSVSSDLSGISSHGSVTTKTRTHMS